MVSTGSKRTMEIAGKDSRKTDQNHKRQLLVAEGGLTAPEDAGSPCHPNQHLCSLADTAAHLCGVTPTLLHALVARESSWNPNARSRSGAVGLGQLMPAAAKEMGVTDRRDPWQNLLGSACYLRKQYDRFGTWREALHAYHAGANRLSTLQVTKDYAEDIMQGAN